MTSTLTNQQRVFKACLTQTEQLSDDVTRKISPFDKIPPTLEYRIVHQIFFENV